MELFIGIYVVILWVANIGLCAWLAGEKNRSQVFWVTASIILGLLATLFLIGAPIAEEKD